MEHNPYEAPSVDPIPSPESRLPGDGPQDWTVGHVLNVGVEAVKKNPGVLIGGYFSIVLVQQVIQSVINKLFFGAYEQAQDPILALQHAGITAPSSLVIGVFFTIGQMRVALAAARDQPVDFGMFYSGFDRMFPGIFLMLAMYIGILLGFVMLVVPGMIVSLAWSLSFALLSDTKMGVREMLGESWEATKGHKLHILLFGFACFGVFLLGVLALFLGIFVAYPIVMVAFAEIYMCITGRRTAEA